MQDEKYRIFILKYNLETDESNVYELQKLYDEGWHLNSSGDEIIHGTKVRVFLHLTISKFRELEE